MKNVNYAGKKDPNRPAKYKSHGSFRAKRKPNSPIVKRQQREEAARNFSLTNVI